MNNSAYNQDPNFKNYFNSVSIDEFFHNYLNKINNLNNEYVTIWEKGESENNAESFKILNFKTNPLLVKLGPLGKLTTNVKGSLKSGKMILIKFPEHEKINYFTTGLLNFHEEDLTYSVELNAKIYQSQRRLNARLTTSTTIQVQFKLNEEVMECYDVSAGGVSFFVDIDDLFRYPINSTYENCALRYSRKKYHIPNCFVVRHSSVEDNKNKIKVGIKFENLIAKIKDELDIKINADIHGECLRKQFEKAFQEPINE